MVADPALTPVTTGACAGEVAPPAMMTLVVTVAFERSLVVSMTNSPPAGAAVDRVTGNATAWPLVTLTLLDTLMDGWEVATLTVTPAVAFETPEALAVIVADPDPLAETGTETLVPLEPKLTLAGAVATPVLLELKFTIRPPDGAGAFRVSVRLCVPRLLKLRLAGENDMLVGPPPPPPPEPPPPTWTVPLAENIP
jgi:hypothetical protein